MDTKKLVDAILLKNENISRSGGAESIHDLLTRCQDVLFSKASNSSIYIDPDTGTHPYLAVTAGIRKYDLPDIQMFLGGLDRDISFSKCLEVYISMDDASEYGIEDQLLEWQEKQWVEVLEDRYVIPIHSVESMDNTPAHIIFKNAPTETIANLYRHISLIRPIPIVDDSIPLMVNSRWYDALIDGVLGHAEYYQYGYSDRLQTFNDYWCNLFWEASERMPRANKVTATRPRRF